MSNLKDTDTDDLFRRASDKYPLRTDSSDWDRMAAALEKDPPPPGDVTDGTDRRKKRRFFWLFFLLPLGAGGLGYYAWHAGARAKMVTTNTNASVATNATATSNATVETATNNTPANTTARGKETPTASAPTAATGTAPTAAIATAPNATGANATAPTAAGPNAAAPTAAAPNATAPNATAPNATGPSATPPTLNPASAKAGSPIVKANTPGSGTNPNAGGAFADANGDFADANAKVRTGDRKGNHKRNNSDNGGGTGITGGNNNDGNSGDKTNVNSGGNSLGTNGNDRFSTSIASQHQDRLFYDLQRAPVDRNYQLNVNVIAPAAKKDSTATKQKKPTKAKTSYLYAGVLVAPDLSTVKMQAIKGVGNTAGALIGFAFNSHWAIETGIYVERKSYYTEGEYFNTKEIPAYYDTLSTVNGTCYMWEIPLNVRYTFNPEGKTKWFATAGFSTYLMTSEKYNYVAEKSSGGVTWPERGSTNIDTASQYPFSIVNLSVGFEQRLGKVGNLRIEPYLRIPLTGMGTGKLPIMSTGINIGITRQLWKK